MIISFSCVCVCMCVEGDESALRCLSLRIFHQKQTVRSSEDDGSRHSAALQRGSKQEQEREEEEPMTRVLPNVIFILKYNGAAF